MVIQHVKLAFALSVVRSIIHADQELNEDEVAYFARRFPVERLREAGFVDAEGRLNDEFTRARDSADRLLQMSLSREDKLALIRDFHEAATVDGSLEIAEYQTLLQAAKALGLTPQEVSAHLDSLIIEEAPPIRRR